MKKKETTKAAVQASIYIYIYTYLHSNTIRLKSRVSKTLTIAENLCTKK